jgi:hypothetical protein
LPCRNLFSGPANPIALPQSFQQSSKSHGLTTIISAGQQIPSPRRTLFGGLANPITASPSL